MTYQIINGDCLDVMRGMDAESVDAIVTDPPYGLEFMGKEWDKLGAVVVDDPSSLGGFQQQGGGNKFSKHRIRYGASVVAAQSWHQQWATEALRIAKPGAHLLAFGGSRTYHRMACAVEDAGWEVRDQIMWLYGSGFPKSHNLNGERKGWGTALKPAHEPIVVARRPLIGTVAANVQRYGTGAINVDGCRVGTNGTAGRWPANVCHDGSEEVTDAGLNGQARFFYCAKADRAERNAGLEGMPGKQRDSSRSMDQPSMNGGSGNPYNRGAHSVTNHHPTVKPVALMAWLCRLVTQPGGLVLDPFAGSGSTGIAALQEGLDFIGIEQDADYCNIARRRLGNAAQDLPLYQEATV